MILNIVPMKKNKINCFGVYWNNNGTFYIALPPKHSGLMIFSHNEIEIINPVFQFKMAYFENETTKFLLHWALVERNLFDDVIGHVESAYQEFLKIIKEEGIVDPDFY